jgi:hypothetical protein
MTSIVTRETLTALKGTSHQSATVTPPPHLRTHQAGTKSGLTPDLAATAKPTESAREAGVVPIQETMMTLGGKDGHLEIVITPQATAASAIARKSPRRNQRRAAGLWRRKRNARSKPV